jgi:hypothetical protein
MPENKIEIVPVELEDIIGTEDVAASLGINYHYALTLLNQNIIPSRRMNGRITTKQVLEKYKIKLQRQS